MATPNLGFLPYGAASQFLDDGFPRKTSPLPPASSSAHGGSPASYGADTDGSEFSASSPPASDDGLGTTTHPMDAASRRDDWDLLSEMLIDEAAMPHGTVADAPAFLGGYDVYGAPPKPPAQTAMYPPPHYAAFPPPAYHPRVPSQPPTAASSESMPAGYLDALLQQDDALLAARAKANAVGSPQTTDLFPRVAPPPPSLHSCSSESEVSPTPSPMGKTRRKSTSGACSSTRSNATSSSSSSSTSVKQEPLSAEEAKKLRRRSQIASSVQRHREKKKCMVASLKSDLASLTSHLASLRTQRKALHAHNETLVAWEEEAITQRRKRKQSEELNQRMKKALFQQTCFLMGMRTIMTNVPAPHELHIHDWLHSYTVLTAREKAARRKEYAACFNDSKVDMARQIVLRETDAFASRLTLASPYFSEIRVLHDGTEVIHHEQDVRLRSELSEPHEFVVPGTGQVVKKYTSMFLFEERGDCTMEAFKHVAMEATKAVGVFWPSPGYNSRALDTIQLDASSQLIFSDLHGSMALIDDQLTCADQDVQLEARMLCRVQHAPDETTIAWDYADKDELYPIDGDRAIRRDSCGAAVVRREPGGRISFRSVCVKMFGPMDTHATAANDVRALTQRRISLQASEMERQNQKCTRSVYESLAAAFTT